MPLKSRIRTHVELEAANPSELSDVLRHLIAAAGNAQLMTPAVITALAQLGMSLTGKENDEAIWKPVVETSYVGPRTGEVYALTAVPDATGAAGACEKLPKTLKLTCKTEQVAVLPAGAALIPGKRRNDDTMPPAQWQPATRQRVAALRCDLTTDGAARPVRRLREEWPLVFVDPPRTGQAPGTGVEWAFANSDMVVQEGGYRWMPSSNGEKRR